MLAAAGAGACSFGSTRVDFIGVWGASLSIDRLLEQGTAEEAGAVDLSLSFSFDDG